MLSNPRILFGVHSFTAYNRTNGLPYGTALVVGNSSFSLSGELASLNGGSNKYPWAVEETNITAELSVTVKQYENWMMQLFLGKAPTAGTPSATGTCSAITNKDGVVVDATKGIASVSILSGSEADLKFGKYVVKLVDKSADTVHVYALSNVDFSRGTDKTFEDDLLRITSTPLVVPSGSDVNIPGFGLKITGGSAVDFATLTGSDDGDTAVFEVLPPDQKSISATFGGSSDVFPEFGAIVVGQKRGNGEMVELDIFRLKAVGLPMGFQEKTFSEAEITAQAFYDADKDGVFSLRHVNPISA
jgi:hypothetical protein